MFHSLTYITRLMALFYCSFSLRLFTISYALIYGSECFFFFYKKKGGGVGVLCLSHSMALPGLGICTALS